MSDTLRHGVGGDWYADAVEDYLNEIPAGWQPSRLWTVHDVTALSNSVGCVILASSPNLSAERG